MTTGFGKSRASEKKASLQVHVLGRDPEVQQIPDIAAQAQTRYVFSLTHSWKALTLYVTHDHEDSLFSLRESGVAVSAWQSEGISRYAGINRTSYFLLCGALGLLQYRALALNPLLRSDDFLHAGKDGCLFATHHPKQEYALLMENPHVCAGCVQFFDCLGCEPEVGALLDVLDFTRNGQFKKAADN
ncbi:MAG: hypothetical protein R6V12_17270 [Candidatus Hydrogenedentota bacterium]